MIGLPAKKFELFVLVIAFVTGFSFQAAGQVSGNNKNNSNSQNSTQNTTSEPPMNFSLGNAGNAYDYYYLDQIGLEMANRAYSQEGYINSKTYVLGPQDLLAIDVRGGLTLSMRAVAVNPQGEVNLPMIGQVNVRGLTLSEAKAKIKKAIDKNFKNSTITVSLDIPRNITIHVTGDVPYPGKYIVPAQTRVDQAIFPALFGKGAFDKNKPNNQFYNGHFLSKNQFALRNIEVFSNDTLQTTADLIDYFRGGNLKMDPYVHGGDVIYIKKLLEQSPRISISGAVKSSLELEYRKGDNVKELINIAGGYTDYADTNEVAIYRQIDNQIKKITVEHSGNNYARTMLQPDDRVIVPEIKEHRSSYSAWIIGEAVNPGNYPIIEGKTTVYNLLNMADGLTPKALPQAAYLIRSKSPIRNVPQPDVLNDQQLQRTSNQDRQGLEYLQLETKLQQNQVYINLQDTTQLKNIHVFDGDKLYIPRNEHTIYIFGQVNNPGYYPYNTDISVQNYIKKAGGLTIAANPKRIFVIKAGSKAWFPPSDTQLKSGDMIFVDRVPYEDLNAYRNYKIQKQNLINSRISLILSAISTTVLLLNFIKFK